MNGVTLFKDKKSGQWMAGMYVKLIISGKGKTKEDALEGLAVRMKQCYKELGDKYTFEK